MGLAQVIERPRNWDLISAAKNTNISTIEDGDFIDFTSQGGFQTFELTRSLYLPYNCVVERLCCAIAANNLTGGSTNNFQLAIDGANQVSSLLALTDATAISTLLETTGLGIQVAAGERIAAEWTSDSAGIASLRFIGVVIRMVNPTA